MKLTPFVPHRPSGEMSTDQFAQLALAGGVASVAAIAGFVAGAYYAHQYVYGKRCAR